MSKEVKIGIVVAVIAMIGIVAYFVYKKDCNFRNHQNNTGEDSAKRRKYSI